MVFLYYSFIIFIFKSLQFLKFKKQFKNDLREGQGKFFWANGDRYEGEVILI